MAILLVLVISLSFSNGQSPKQVNLKNLTRQYDQAFRVGESRWKEGNFQEALQLLKTARELAQEMKDAEKDVKCLMLLGKLCWALGQPEDSKKFYSAALSGAKDTNLKREAEESELALGIWKLYSQGQAELFAGKHEKSIATFNSALELAGKIGSKEHEVKCLRQLSLIYWAKQDLKNFLSINERSLKMAQELNDRREKAKSLINTGLYYLKMGDYSRALNCYSDALDTSRDTKNKRDESLCLKNIGLILSQLGFYERSLDYLLEAHDIDRQSGNIVFFSQNMINLGEGFRNRGLIFANREDLYKALDYFTEALDSGQRNGDKETELRALNNIGNIHLNLEKYYSAETYFRLTQQIAEKVQDSEARIEVLNNLGICNFKTENVEKAQTYFQAALEQGKPVGKDKILWETLFYLGRCYEEKGAIEKALDCYRNSIDAIEHIRSKIIFDYHKVGFMKNKLKVYEAVVDLLYWRNKDNISSNKAEEIFYTVERAKARAFLETLGEEKRDFRGRLNPSLEKKENEVSSRISAVIQEMAKRDLSPSRRLDLQKTLKRFEDEYLNFISRIRVEVPDIANVVFPLPIRVKQAQEWLLDEKTAILEYFLGEKNSLLFLMTKKKLNIFPLPPRKEIESSINAYIKLLSDPPKGEWTGALAAERLSRDLLFPAMKILPQSVERLIFIPDGPLLYLPFDTLALLSAGRSSGEDFLISKYTISYAPSCSSLLFLKERKKKDRYVRNLLAFGNPLPPSDMASDGKKNISVANILRETYEGQGFDFSSLPQSDREIKYISSFFSKNDRTICLHREASKEMIRNISLEDYQIIHFACHGFIDEKIPYRSALVLSWNEHSREDGFLQVREIANLRLAAELVVLSACETGRGRIENGEGILGITRSFFYSGARSVVSALWKIGDKATAMFMRRFYYYLSLENDKAQAVRLAKLALLRSKYSHPFYWAPFVLHGESSSPLDFR
jgi:CHAT domain-containing protein/Tfp pilus assembly protein PilF